MVGGTRIHRQIHERALVEMKEREEFLLGEENTSPAARTLFVSLDRADAIIEGGPDVSSEDELGCPTCRGYTWVFAFLLGRRNLCGILFCRGCDFEFSFHAIHTIGLKFTIDKHTKSMVPLRVLSRTNLARFALSTSSISFLSFRLRTLKLSCRSFSHPDPLFSITSALFLQNTRGGIPLRDLARCTEAQKCLFVSPLLATLTHSVSRKSFPCHSYANTRDRGVTVAPVSRAIFLATRHSPLSCYPSLPPSHALRRLRVLCVSALSFASILLALCFHTLTNCFSRNSLVLITIRIARGVTPSHA